MRKAIVKFIVLLRQGWRSYVITRSVVLSSVCEQDNASRRRRRNMVSMGKEYLQRVSPVGGISPRGCLPWGNIFRGYLRWGEYLQVCLWWGNISRRCLLRGCPSRSNFISCWSESGCGSQINCSFSSTLADTHFAIYRHSLGGDTVAALSDTAFYTIYVFSPNSPKPPTTLLLMA